MMSVLSFAFTLAAHDYFLLIKCNFYPFTFYLPFHTSPRVDQCPIHAPFTCTVGLDPWGQTLPYSFVVDDRICLKLQQLISRISFSSTLKSLFYVFKAVLKRYWEKGKIASFSGTPCMALIYFRLVIGIYGCS